LKLECATAETGQHGIASRKRGAWIETISFDDNVMRAAGASPPGNGGRGLKLGDRVLPHLGGRQHRLPETGGVD